MKLRSAYLRYNYNSLWEEQDNLNIALNKFIDYVHIILKGSVNNEGIDLQKQYLEWYKAKSSFKNLNSKTVRIDVPFLDNFSDEVTMYAIENSNNTITLTDDGWTIDN